MKQTRFRLLTGLLALTSCALAWGPEGHKMVAGVAKAYMQKSTVDSVQKYLGSTTFEEASVWMDEIKSNHDYDYMKPWHYVNIDRDKTYVNTPEWNVVNVLIKAIDELKNRHNRAKAETAMYLKILFHLAGDIHQPLHVGYGDDRGGNDEKVKFLGTLGNLHRVWDEDIIVEKKISLQTCLAMAPSLSDKEKLETSSTNVVSWMNDSRLLLPQVYDFKDHSIDQAYVDKNAPVIEKQILIGGMQLAAVLNEVFRK